MASRLTRRIFPHPLLTLLLTLVWCLLINTPSSGAVAFGLILGILTFLPFLKLGSKLLRSLGVLRETK